MFGFSFSLVAAAVPRPAARSNAAAALRARHREHVLDHSVILVAATGQGVGASGGEAAVEKKTLVDMEGDHLAERKHGPAKRAAQGPDFDDLDHLAFQCG